RNLVPEPREQIIRGNSLHRPSVARPFDCNLPGLLRVPGTDKHIRPVVDILFEPFHAGRIDSKPPIEALGAASTMADLRALRVQAGAAHRVPDLILRAEFANDL